MSIPTLCLRTGFPLPGELIDAILGLLSPIELAMVSQVCQSLRVHAMADRLWQAHVQNNVPGSTVTMPHPCTTFRELYIAYEPVWFLTKYKIWFSSHGMAGKTILTRYDQRRGCIEGYEMAALSSIGATYYNWPLDANVVIHAFEPQVMLRMNRPVLKLNAKRPENHMRRGSIDIGPSAGQTHAVPNVPAPGILAACIPSLTQPASATVPTSASSASVSVSAPTTVPIAVSASTSQYSIPTWPGRFHEIPMFSDSITSEPRKTTFTFAKPLHADQTMRYTTHSFPNDGAWPPASVPACHRVMATNFLLDYYLIQLIGRPMKRSDVSNQAFYIRTSLDKNPHIALEEQRMVGRDKIETYATVDPVHYTPTADKLFRGIWVGDYGGHGCEFLLIHQPDDLMPFNESTVRRREGESDADLAKRRRDACIYRGRLEAIKLTGDFNVPRGEYTFVAEELGDAGLDCIMQEPPFVGVRVVKSLSHVADTEFRNERYVESQLLLVSPNQLALHWVGFGHIAFFERVDIDRFLGT